MTVQFKSIFHFDRLSEEEAKEILYKELLPTCEAVGVKLCPEGHRDSSLKENSYEHLKATQSIFSVSRVQRAFAAVDFIYKPADKYQNVWKLFFENHPQGGYVGGGELMAAMMLKGLPAKFGEDKDTLELRAQFPVKQICSGRHRTRLFVGESTFRGVSSFIEKHKNRHPELGRSILATELKTFARTSDHCPQCEDIPEAVSETAVQKMESKKKFCGDLCERIAFLKSRGVQVILGFDGTKIHEHPLTSEKIFARIHWNCPHDGSDYRQQTLPPIIRSFFASARQVQEEGHRVHITLAQPIDGWDKSPFYQGVVYNICEAAESSGYHLYAKRPFDAGRYPGYVHEQTGRMDSAAGANRLREFVFINGSPPEDRNPSECRSQHFGCVRGTRNYYHRDTDNESSSCSSSDDSE